VNDFRTLDERFAASAQITLGEVVEARRRGFAVIVNNRPEGEAEDQTPGAEIEEAARAAGMGYVAIPVSHTGFSEAQVSALADAMQAADGPVLAYCRSGTRSTLLWALTEARQGQEPATIAEKARAAGYDVAPIMPLIEMLFAQSARS
jgi:uncharacterized protein (TIGR01244 family)